jgi:hypothetical protein
LATLSSASGWISRWAIGSFIEGIRLPPWVPLLEYRLYHLAATLAGR